MVVGIRHPCVHLLNLQLGIPETEDERRLGDLQYQCFVDAH